MSNKTKLVIAAHPDDEVLGCGGSIAKWSSEGCQVVVLILGEGITSRFSGDTAKVADEVQKLHQKSRKAADLLGVVQLHILDFPDNKFDTVPLLRIVKEIEKTIQQYEPTEVYTQHGGDLNIDHVITYRATITATRPLEGCPVDTVYAYEVASSSEWAFNSLANPFTPNCFVDISDYTDVKLKAMSLYDTEVRVFPHPRSPEALQTQAEWRGIQGGMRAAEAFQIIRMRK